MPLATLRQVLDEAAKGGYGVGAFNVNNMEQLQGIVDAAAGDELAGDRPGLARRDRLRRPELPAPPDHGGRRERAGDPDRAPPRSRRQAGDVLHGDRARLHERDDGRLAARRRQDAVGLRVQRRGHARGRRGRAREGRQSSRASSARSAGSRTATAPARCTSPIRTRRSTSSSRPASTRSPSRSARATAPTSSPRSPTGDVLAMHLIEEIHTKLPETHMVMHGSSSVPPELVDRINAAGGKLEATFGVPVEEIQQGIRHGVRKVNVDTDGRLAITAALRESLQAHPSEFDPRAFFKPARIAMKEVVAQRMNDFGSAGHAGDYTVLLSRRDGRSDMRGAPSVPDRRPRPAEHQHDPHADGRRRPGGQLRAIRARRSGSRRPRTCSTRGS